MSQTLSKRKIDRARSILATHNYALPFPIAEYFCRMYRDNIVCAESVTYRLFKPFVSMRERVVYNFAVPPELYGTSGDRYFNIKLESVTVKREGTQHELDTFSNILSEFFNSNIDWGEDESVCKIVFDR